MPILDAGDIAQIAADLARIREDNEVTIQIRRDSGTAPGPQTVRIERRRSQFAVARQDTGTEETVTDVIVTGPTTLDIAKEDRFNYAGELYRVTAVRPNRQVDTQAEAQRVT